MSAKLPRYSVMILLLLSLVITLAYVQVRISVYDLSYRITDNLKTQRDQNEKNRQLKLEVASLKAPSRIENFAIKKLGMKLDSGSKVILMKNEDEDTKE